MASPLHVLFRRLLAAIGADNPSLVMLPESRREAREQGAGRYFTGKPCKAGHVAERRPSGGHCDACFREYEHEYRKRRERREYRREYDREYQKRPEWLAWARDYERTVHADFKRARVAARRALKLKATPKWLTTDDKAAIRAIYEEAARLTIETGIPHHVDHVVPLKAKCPVTRKRVASGLHVPWNLEVVKASDNLAKGCYLET